MRQNNCKKIGGFCLIFLAVYSIIWLILEPLQIDFNPNKCIYREILLASSLLLTIFIFIIMNYILELQSFGFGNSDTNILDSATKGSGNPTITIANDQLNEKSLEIKGTFNEDAVKWDVNVLAKYSSKVKFIFYPVADLRLYLRITLKKKDTGSSQLVWISFRDDIKEPVRGGNGFEYSCPVKFKKKDENWLEYQMNFKKVVKKLFPDYEYKRVEYFQIKGNGKILKMILK